MDIEREIGKLKRHQRVYLHDSPIYKDNNWIKFQLKEKEFWRHLILETNYHPDPWINFAPFFNRWAIPFDFFREKNVLEIGSGPFGFFSGLNKEKGNGFLPQKLVIADSLMDFYQNFDLFSMIPDKAICLQAPGEDIPLSDQTFDVVLTTNTIDHVQNPDCFLREIGRLLRPDGVLLFSVHSIVWYISFFRWAIRRLDHNHPHHFLLSEVEILLKQNGFLFESITYRPLFKEDAIPPDLNLFKKVVYTMGFYSINTVYGVARKAN